MTEQNINTQPEDTVIDIEVSTEAGTVNDGKFDVKVNGVRIGGTSANTPENTEVDIQVPTTVAELSDASEYAKTTAVESAVSGEAEARGLADNNLQSQIDAITASSDVTDIVGTYAELEAYDTSKLGDKDIIKVLQDESHNGETTYYRWGATAQTFTLIGEEGPYYTKSQTDTLLAGKQKTLTAGTNVSIAQDGTISATDTTYTAGTGLSLTGTEFSADTTTLATQTDLSDGLATKQNTLTAGSNIQINNDTISATDTTYTAGTNVSISSGNVISATDTTYSNFTGTDGTTAGAPGLVPAPATTDAGKYLSAGGTWDTVSGGIPTNTTFWGRPVVNGAVSGDIYFDGSGLTLRSISLASSSSLRFQGGAFNFYRGNDRLLGVSTSQVIVENKPIRSVADPTNPQDAATKNYVDTHAGAVAFPTSTFNSILEEA